MVQFVPEIVSYVLVRFFFALSTMAGSFDQKEYAFLSLRTIFRLFVHWTLSKWNLKLPFCDDGK